MKTLYTAALCAAFFLALPVSAAKKEVAMETSLLNGKIHIACAYGDDQKLRLTLVSQPDFSGSVRVESVSGSRILHRLQGRTTLNLGLSAEQLPVELTAGDEKGESETIALGEQCKTAP